MLTSFELVNLLRDNGYKVTPQRLAIYEALAEQEWHPNAEMLYNKLKPRFTAMSFATVYKTMEILQKLQVVTIMNTGEDSFRYDATMHDHDHIQCTCCGNIMDVKSSTSQQQQLTESVEKNTGYTVEKTRFYFYGVCPDCRKAN